MQEKKYGTAPTDEILKDCMVHGFERMCVVYESIVAMVCHFPLHNYHERNYHLEEPYLWVTCSWWSWKILNVH